MSFERTSDIINRSNEFMKKIKTATLEDKIAAVKEDGYLITEIIMQSQQNTPIQDELLEAVFEDNGSKYFWVRLHASNAVQLTAAKRLDVNVLHFEASKISEEVQMALLRRDIRNTERIFSYIAGYATHNVQCEAVRLCGSNIRHIRNPSEKLKLLASL